MKRVQAAADLEIQALAAVGEAVLFHNRGNPAATKELLSQGMRFVAANAVAKKLTELCKNAGHDPNWRTSTEARLLMLGRSRIESVVASDGDESC
ncbi:MAG: hypothetical protein PHP70_06615 [Gallionella sp.]|nr:hypothetical protein [Gallionella sp.]